MDPLARYAELPEDEQGRVVMTDAQWREFLSPPAYRILREGGTEWRGTGDLLDEEAEGAYHCAGCGAFLYSSEHKFHSGCGWPAFDDEVEGAIVRLEDNSLGVTRTEIRCRRCDGHLGHVFYGEQMTENNMRHCVNSAALLFVPAE